LFGGFSIYVNDESLDHVISKSPKGMALLEYLILKYDTAVPNYKLIEALWPNEESTNPENALKTLISRFRSILNQCSPGLGNCIVATRGGYQFDKLEEMTLDLFVFEEISRKLSDCIELTPESSALYQEIIRIYHGDLLAGNDQYDWAVSRSVNLHSQYIKLIYAYLDLLKKEMKSEEIILTCRCALENDPFDERLHLELMQALVKVNRNNEAFMQYRHVTNMYYRYLGVKPPDGIHEFYKQIIQAGNILDMNIDTIRRELQDIDDREGAFQCEYAVFREIFNLQMRSLERVGGSIFIAIVMISSIDGDVIHPLKLDDIMHGLSGVLKKHLRKGDTFTQFSPSQYVLLLPTVSADTGRIALERLKRSFYQSYPSSNVMFSYRIGPLSSRTSNVKAASMQ
jgi:DNA-binding SARP family transcriptional activator